MLETRRESPGRAGVTTSGFWANASEPGAPFSQSGTESPCAPKTTPAQNKANTTLFMNVCASVCIRGLNQKTRNLNPRSHAFHHGNPAIRDSKAARPVTLPVEPNRVPWRDMHVLVENRALHLRMAPNIHVVEQDAVFHKSDGVNANAAAQHRTLNASPGKNAAAGNHRIDRLAAPALLIERKLRRRVRETVGAQR